MDWLKKATPWLVTALTGGVPGLAAMAAAEVSKVYGVEATPEAATNALNSGVNSEQMIQLKKIELDFKGRMVELGYKNIEELERIAAGDRDSARNRQIQLKDNTPTILAYIITAGFFAVLVYVIVNGLPVEGRDALLLLLGSLAAGWTGMLAYFYGTSSSSRSKDQTINTMVNK